MKKNILVALLVLLFAGSASALNVAVIDIKKVMADSKAAISARGQLEAKQKEFQTQVSATEAKLQKNDQELAKQRNLLSAEAFKTKLDEFRQQAASAQKDVQTKQMQLRRAFEESIATIQERMSAIVKAVATEKNYDLVMPANGLLYSKDEMNITSEVLSRLDKELPSMKVNFGQ
jgi:Skp family chaperone for outer membrane proteins